MLSSYRECSLWWAGRWRWCRGGVGRELLFHPHSPAVAAFPQRPRCWRQCQISVPTEWTPALLMFPSAHSSFQCLLLIQLYTNIFLLLFSWNISWATGWVCKIDEAPSAISVFIKGAEVRGSWVLACVWEVFVLTVWWLHTSLKESQMSLACDGIIVLLFQRVFYVNLPACLATFKIKVKDNPIEQWNKIQSLHSSL